MPQDSGNSCFAQFIAELTKHLEDGNDANSVEHFIATNYMPKPQGKPRNKIIILVNEYLPELTQRQLAEVCGASLKIVHLVLKGEDTGGGGRGHGGAWREPAASTPVVAS
jgi:hypothetical protein